MCIYIYIYLSIYVCCYRVCMFARSMCGRDSSHKQMAKLRRCRVWGLGFWSIRVGRGGLCIM